MLEENVKQRAQLKEKTFELEALTSKYRKIQSMLQSGQYIQAINTTVGPTTASPMQSQNTLADPTGPSTTLLLTSRSPTRERVAFNTIAEEKILPTGPMNVVKDKKVDSGLRSSPLMSSATQITTTNTTSSTNNTTDLTTDYPSSKLISTATTSNNGAKGTGHLGVCFVSGKRDILKPTLIDQKLVTLNQQVTLANSAITKHKQLSDHHEDLNLFSLLSNMNNRSEQRYQDRPKDEGANQSDNKFGKWLEGPFCTVMVRQAGLDLKQMKAGFKKQTSQKEDSPSSSAIYDSRKCLPRTLSMIEYLGLTELDLVARRHDKIIRFKRDKRSLGGSCLETHSCGCYATHGHAQANPMHQMAASAHSDGNIIFSSSDRFNSNESLPTSASCSTCCSFASQTYGSQSEIFHEEYHTSNSDSSQTVSSSLSRSSVGARHRFYSESRSSSQSSSINDQSNSITAPRYCEHRLQQSATLHHYHHHHRSMQRQAGHSPYHSGHQQCHPHHYHSTGTVSVSSSNPGALSKTNKTQAKVHERSLCTSGVLYGAPGSKEDANQAAQTTLEAVAPISREPTSLTSGGVTEDSITTIMTESTTNDDCGAEVVVVDSATRKISIQCDVIEQL